ncbi:MAG: hypothetical protein ACRDGQ_00485, partial [Candidatus Limnocylindrales bacterium]
MERKPSEQRWSERPSGHSKREAYAARLRARGKPMGSELAEAAVGLLALGMLMERARAGPRIARTARPAQ